MSGSHHASEGRCKVGSGRSGKGVVGWGERVGRARKWRIGVSARNAHGMRTECARNAHEICMDFEPVSCTSFNWV